MIPRIKTLAVLVLAILMVGTGSATAAPWDNWKWPTIPAIPGFNVGTAQWQNRMTGADMASCQRWAVCGTDLGIPYALPQNNSVAYLFGDTFNTAWPEQPNNDWRSPVGLRSNVHPRDGAAFDSAFKVRGNGRAPELFWNGHHSNGEVTVIPNDGVVLPDGRHVVSYQSIRDWNNTGGRNWLTNYAGLAVSNNGNDFQRTGLKWLNNGAGNDPYQMWSMQLAGDYVYIITVPGGRQNGPMMLMRVRWDRILDQNAYEGWGFHNGSWKWNVPATPILQGRFGEPSLRLLSDGTWAMSYLNVDTGSIVSRTASQVDGMWSPEKVQVTQQMEPNAYGGGIHPWSTKNEVYFMVSTWRRNQQGQSTAYHVSLYRGSL